MRLDHLLSKEHLAHRARPLEGGVSEVSRSMRWLLGMRAVSRVRQYVRLGGRGTRKLAAGTCRAHCSALGVRAPGHLENWIASASIYLPSYEGLTVDALAPGADEGRVRLRNASGSRREGRDPRVSEWGNPAGVMPGHPGLNP